MNTILFWLWHDPESPRRFSAANLNQVVRAIARKSSETFRYVCVSDDSAGLDLRIEWLATPHAAKAIARLKSPEGKRFPSCYRRLWTFSAEAAQVLGTRVLALDIDHVPVGDYARLFDRKELFVGWRPYRDWGNACRFGGGTYLLTPGTRTRVWNSFCRYGIKEARAAGYRGSDQAWISYCLAPHEPYFGREAGVYSIRDFKHRHQLPKDATLVHFNGKTKPWDSDIPWVKEHLQ